MADSGVRSSCEASAANRRSRASLAARRRSAVCTWPSIRLKARPTWPVSVAGSVSGTPAGSSTSSESSGSSATCDAVAATRRSGRSENLTQRVPPAPASSSTAPKTAASASATRRSVSCRVDSGRPVMKTALLAPGPLTAVSRNVPPASVRSRVLVGMCSWLPGAAPSPAAFRGVMVRSAFSSADESR